MRSKLLLAGTVLALAGCATAGPQYDTSSIDPAIGEAVKWNQAVQTIDPDPVYTDADAQPGYHGEKGANATKRYRSDQVKQVEQTSTTAGGSGGGPQ